MSNFALGWRNRIFTELDASLTLNAGTLAAGTLSALQDMRLSRRVTVTDTSDGGGTASIVITWAVASGTVAVDLLGLLNYEVLAPDAAYVTVSLTASGPGGSYASNETWSRPAANFPLHLWSFCDARVFADTVTIEITAAFGGAGEVLSLTAGALWAGPIWTLPVGIDASWSQAVVDPGAVGRSVGGQGYPRRRQRYRSFEGRAIHIPFAYAFGDESDASVLDIQQLLYRIGTTEPIALFPRTRDASGELSTHIIHRLGIYGHLAEAGRIEHLGGDFYQWTGVRVDELM